ncbi:hypothetical protein ACFWGC_24355 [Cytobacillus pseudoceanisediminis]|uniref:hypothetical protein n=1 Tax=Cytobacillus TaxID=2675230 RepID=UPI001587F792|nr:hypothetical protein [Cytobacillus oceanisediminis]
MNIVNISQSKNTPYFYMLLDYGNCYLCLRSHRRTYALDIVRVIGKEEISLEEAAPLLEEGDKFFRQTDQAVQKYFKKYGIE